MIAAYMRALYNIQKPEANFKSLHHFYDVVEAYVRGLESLGKTPYSYGDLLVCILIDKLPSDIRKSVARRHDEDEFSLEEQRKALKAELRAGQLLHWKPVNLLHCQLVNLRVNRTLNKDFLNAW